jgi:hypothetical protein
MREKILSNTEVLGLSTKLEGHFYDRKTKETDGKKIQKIACAFANADGGEPIASPEEAIMGFLHNSDKIKNKQARELTGIKSENKMKVIFYKLRDQNMIKPVMSRNGSAVVA